MGVKRDNVPFAGVHEGTESPKNKAKRRSSLCGRSGLTEPKADQTTAGRTKQAKRRFADCQRQPLQSVSRLPCRKEEHRRSSVISGAYI